ncbi:PA1414 family protein [Pseudomonas leptonychotis]|nr:PA1414 family protein [Pseudomonas leptonychotis]
MNTKFCIALFELLVALGLYERPQLQPVPVRSHARSAQSRPARH